MIIYIIIYYINLIANVLCTQKRFKEWKHILDSLDFHSMIHQIIEKYSFYSKAS